MNTIALNGMYLTRRASGIANFIVDAANELSKTNHIIIFANNKLDSDIFERLEKTNVTFIIKYRKHSTLWFFLDFPQLLKKQKFDLLWNPAVWSPMGVSKSIKKLVLVHDFVSREFKSTMRIVNRIVSSFVEKRSIINADYIWCNSNYTAEKLRSYYPKRKSERIFVGDAPSSLFKNLEVSGEEKRRISKEYGITKPFLMFVGTLEPRKNLSFLLKVFQEYHKQNNIQMIVVGANGWGKTLIADIVNAPAFPAEDIVFTRYVSNDDLLKLYNLASCFISTSLNEGFGMPQAEAMKCGCPVVTAHNSAMIEVVFGAGITVEGWNERNWCKAIDYALENHDEIVTRQYNRAKLYDWKNVISGLLKYINDD